MTNIRAILDDLNEGPYILTSEQEFWLPKNQNLAKTAEWLPGLFQSIRKGLAKQLDMLPEQVPPYVALNQITLDIPIRIASGDAEKIPPLDMLLIGRRSINTIDVLYADILGRAPDEAGRAHYQGQFKDGRPRWEIVKEIELSQEAAKVLD